MAKSDQSLHPKMQSESATKVWFVLSVISSITTTAILFAFGSDTDKDVARLEQRVKELEGSAASLKDNVSDLSRQVEKTQEHFWE